MVQFENDTISLEIPEDGVCLENGWTITPLVPPVIDKQQVHRFKPQQEVPYCRLQVKLDKGKTEPTDLKHRVKLHGAKSPRYFFTITCPPEECVERQNGDTNEKRKPSGGIEQGVLKERHFSDDTPNPTPLTTDSGIFSPESTASSPKGGKPETKPILKDLIDAFYHKVADKWNSKGNSFRDCREASPQLPCGDARDLVRTNVPSPHLGCHH